VLRPLGLVGLLLAAPSGAMAAALSVAPTRIDLAPDQRAAAVTLQNDGDEPVMVQVQTFAWTGSPATIDLTPTRDLVAMPPVATVAAGDKQLIRVAARGGDKPAAEQSYRLIITEVPPETKGPQAGVRFALRLSLPVFVTPVGAAPDPVWSVERGGAGPRLALANHGSAHLQVRRISVMSPDRGKVLKVLDQPAYVLPSQRHEWPLPAGLPNPLPLKLDTDVGELDATVPAAGR
jgi:fimbrial chaperone protein